MRAPFVVLVATEMPAVLAEVACISNEREARLLGLCPISTEHRRCAVLRDQGVRVRDERLK